MHASAAEHHALVATNLRKQFGTVAAVDGLNLIITPGQIFGLLGPNGAGKTSTMRMMACLLRPDSGSLKILGHDCQQLPRTIKRQIGVVPQEDNLDQYLTVTENLQLYGGYFQLPRRLLQQRIDALLADLNLHKRANETVRNLSGGMKRRLLVARALVNAPHIVILDEPTTGLDPSVRQLLWDHLLSLKAQGKTLILSTHYMEEAEQLCDRLVIMEKGRTIADGTSQALIRAHVTPQVVEVLSDAAGQDIARAVAQEMGADVKVHAQRLVFYIDDDVTQPSSGTGNNKGAHLHATLRQRLGDNARLWLRQGSLEDVYLALTGRTLEDGDA